MVAIVLVTLSSRRLCDDSIDTLKLARRGVDLSRRQPSRLELITVDSAMNSVQRPVSADTGLVAMIDRFSLDGVDVISVVDRDDQYRRVVTVSDGEQLVEADHDEATAGEARTLVSVCTGASDPPRGPFHTPGE